MILTKRNSAGVRGLLPKCHAEHKRIEAEKKAEKEKRLGKLIALHLYTVNEAL